MIHSVFTVIVGSSNIRLVVQFGRTVIPLFLQNRLQRANSEIFRNSSCSRGFSTTPRSSKQKVTPQGLLNVCCLSGLSLCQKSLSMKPI